MGRAELNIYLLNMERVQGTESVQLLECTNPRKNLWRIRWDVKIFSDGSATYMEEELAGKPDPDTIKSLITGWYNDQIDKQIVEGFKWNGMQVWLSAENQFNYKAAYDLAVQTNGATLPVTFKFGNESPLYHKFDKMEELSSFYLSAMTHIQKTLSDGWIMKDAVDLSIYE